MKIIQEKDKTAEKVLGQQKWKDGTTPRFLTYCVAVACDDGVLLHNVMTKEQLLLEGEEANALNADGLNSSQVLSQADTPLFAYLCGNWYIVPQDHDDKELCLSLRAVARQLHEARNAGRLVSFTILTTTACNAKCFYCYERGAKQEDMSRETALKVVDFIKRSCGGKEVTLHWYGGEPLFNLEPIDIITSGLAKEGIEFNSSMITNGYLFDEGLIRKAKEYWKLKKVQITLDGTEEVYNRRKAYIYKGVNAFVRVTDNIERLLKADIQVSVRLNLDGKNFDDLMVLANYIVSRYGKYEKISAYSRYIYDENVCGPINGNEYSLSKCVLMLNKRLMMGKKSIPKKLGNEIALYQCMADSDTSVVIQTNGNLSKCQHFFNSHPCGTIEKGICDAKEVERCRESDTYLKVCDSCPIYPNCIRLAICPYSFAKSRDKTNVACAGMVVGLKHVMLFSYNSSKKPALISDGNTPQRQAHQRDESKI